MNFKIYYKKLNKQGFTIVEVAISIFVLSIAVIGVYSAFTLVALLTSDIEERFIGVYLAQEGIEIIRNIRDTNWVLGKNWEDIRGIYDNGDCSNGCQADYTANTDTSLIFPWAGGAYLYIDNNGFYGYGDVTKTKFKRKIIIEETGAGAIHVSVEVSWNKKATMLSPEELAGTADCSASESNCVVFEEYMYDWH